jgi:hypothetical protein
MYTSQTYSNNSKAITVVISEEIKFVPSVIETAAANVLAFQQYCLILHSATLITRKRSRFLFFLLVRSLFTMEIFGTKSGLFV